MHYSEALKCLNECLEYAGDTISDIYFRRAQVLTYNKFSGIEDYQNALKDVEKALILSSDNSTSMRLYSDLKEELEALILKEWEKDKRNLQGTDR